MILRYLTLLMVIPFFMGCDKDSDDSGINSEFIRNKRKWENAKISDYSIQESYSCFCGGLLEWEIVVKNSVKDTLIFDESQLRESQTYETVFDNARSIEGAFDFIENFETENVFLFEVDYDKEYGFPTRIYVDSDERLADDEIGYLHSDFKDEMKK